MNTINLFASLVDDVWVVQFTLVSYYVYMEVPARKGQNSIGTLGQSGASLLCTALATTPRTSSTVDTGPGPNVSSEEARA